MKFTQIDLVVEGVDVAYAPYDRGQNGAFVYRQVGTASIYAPRLVATTSVNDLASDKLVVQNSHPQTRSVEEVEEQIGTDLVKTELRFLATTSKQSRILQIDTHIAALEELRQVIEDREVIYT